MLRFRLLTLVSIGGTLGFHCAHAYAHTHDRVTGTLPWALKGIDAVFYAVFDKLGLVVNLRAVVEGTWEFHVGC